MTEGWPLKLTALLTCCLVASHSLADSKSEANTARIEKLEALVTSLEKRVSALEGPSGQKPAAAQDVPNQLANWRSLRKGMSKKQVKDLLGEPDKVSAAGSTETWYWSASYGSTVTFYDERLFGWREPD
jgi:hypothetical protein